MKKARRHHTKWLRPLVSVWFQVLFHPVVHGTFHLSFTVLVHYRSLRSIQPYQMVLVDSDRITHVPPYSGYCQVYKSFQIQGYHLLWPSFPTCSSIIYKSTLQSYNPRIAETILVWAIFPFRSPLLGKSLLFSLPPGTQMFQFSGFALCNTSSTYQVTPFGNLRINLYLPIPAAYRSLSRPSSPLRAQAFTVCP